MNISKSIENTEKILLKQINKNYHILNNNEKWYIFKSCLKFKYENIIKLFIYNKFFIINPNHIDTFHNWICKNNKPEYLKSLNFKYLDKNIIKKCIYISLECENITSLHFFIHNNFINLIDIKHIEKYFINFCIKNKRELISLLITYLTIYFSTNILISSICILASNNKDFIVNIIQSCTKKQCNEIWLYFMTNGNYEINKIIRNCNIKPSKKYLNIFMKGYIFHDI